MSNNTHLGPSPPHRRLIQGPLQWPRRLVEVLLSLYRLPRIKQTLSSQRLARLAVMVVYLGSFHRFLDPDQQKLWFRLLLLLLAGRKELQQLAGIDHWEAKQAKLLLLLPLQRELAETLRRALLELELELEVVP